MGKPKKAEKSEAKKPEASVADSKTVVDTGPADPMAGKSAADLAAPADGGQMPQGGDGTQEPAAGRTWTPLEIVDGETRVVGESEPAVHRLERAQELPLLPEKMVGRPPRDGIEAFKDTDGRTMRVLVVGGQLFKQEV
jgi:hypothetical protein